MLRLAHASLLEHGYVDIAVPDITQLAEREHTPDHVVDLVLKKFESDGWLRRSTAVSFDGEMVLIIEYEQHTDEGRKAAYPLNRLRRQVLTQAARAMEAGQSELDYSSEGEKFIDVPYDEIQSAVRVLETYQLISRLIGGSAGTSRSRSRPTATTSSRTHASLTASFQPGRARTRIARLCLTSFPK